MRLYLSYGTINMSYPRARGILIHDIICRGRQPIYSMIRAYDELQSCNFELQC